MRAVFGLGVLLLLGAACDSPKVLGPPGPMTVTPGAGPVCPTRHLAVAARSVGYDLPPMVLRFDESLTSCRGYVHSEQSETLSSIGGMPDGSELLGFDGRIMRVSDRTVVWSHEDSRQAKDIFSMRIEGSLYVVVLWSSSRTGSSDGIELRDPETGEVNKEFDVGSDDVAMAPSHDRSDRIVIADDYDGFREVAVSLSAEALSSTGELVVDAPRSGEFEAVATSTGNVAIAARDGIVHWNPTTTDALGPATCRWARYVADPAPPTCEGFTAVAIDALNAERWFALCDVAESGEALVSVGRRDDCAVLLADTAAPDHELVDLAWAGE